MLFLVWLVRFFCDIMNSGVFLEWFRVLVSCLCNLVLLGLLVSVEVLCLEMIVMLLVVMFSLVSVCVSGEFLLLWFVFSVFRFGVGIEVCMLLLNDCVNVIIVSIGSFICSVRFLWVNRIVLLFWVLMKFRWWWLLGWENFELWMLWLCIMDVLVVVVMLLNLMMFFSVRLFRLLVIIS